MDTKRKLNTCADDKPVETKSNFFPTCRVCDGPGNGIHYGVNTCDACKGFFHRSLRLHGQYKCVEETRPCRIKFGTGKMCQQCRYEKCLEMGLSKEATWIASYVYYDCKSQDEAESNGKLPQYSIIIIPRRAIKKGRYTSEKKTEFILQAKRREMDKKHTKANVHHLDNLSDSDPMSHSGDSFFHRSPDKTVSSSTRPTPTDTKHTALPSGSAPSSNAFSTHRGDTKFPTTFSSSTIERPISPDSNFNPVTYVHDSHHQQPPPSSDNSQSSISFKEDLATPLALTHISKAAHSVSSSSTSAKRSSTPGAYENFCENPSPSTTHRDPGCCHRPDFSMTNNESDLISRLYKDHGAILKTLADARATALQDHTAWTKEEAHVESLKHYEQCKLKTAVFGQLGRIPDEEYNHIYEETGIDVDGRLTQFSAFADGLEKCIRRMVKFVKAIPGFHALDMNEKINLVKYGRLEFAMICNYVYANVELGVIRCMSNRWICTLEALRHNSPDAFKGYLRICARLQSVELNEDERTILLAMSAMSPHRSDPENSSIMQQIHWNLSEMFMNSLSKFHKNPQFIYSQVMEVLNIFRQFEKRMVSCVKSFNIEKYHLLNEKPLVKEMVTDFYISPADLDL